jgi:hypothetical protein
MSKETEQLLVRISGYVARNQQFYDADVDIYGSFSDIYAEIEDHAEHFS